MSCHVILTECAWAGQGELPHNYSESGAVYLQHGWHLARIVWFQVPRRQWCIYNSF